MTMKLVENWNKAHRMISMQCMAAASTVMAAWMQLPDDMKSKLPDSMAQLVGYAVLALLVLGMSGRLIHQPGVDDNGDGFPDTQPLDKTP